MMNQHLGPSFESMKCGAPVVGKIPFTISIGYLKTDFGRMMVIKFQNLGTYVLAFLDGVELTEDVKEKMNMSHLPYTKKIHNESTLSIFTTIITQRSELIKIR